MRAERGETTGVVWVGRIATMTMVVLVPSVTSARTIDRPLEMRCVDDRMTVPPTVTSSPIGAAAMSKIWLRSR